MHGLRDLGCQASINFNRTFPDVVNIIIGVHLLPLSIIKTIPKNCIVLNTEQIYSDSSAWVSNIIEWARNFPVWDYNSRNIEKWNELGFSNVSLLRLGYHPLLDRIPKEGNKDIDVLFYGSIGDRRKVILDEMLARGINLKAVFGVYGSARDDLIARSKIILNLHHYNSKIFEVVRVFYLMINAKAVVSEIDDSTCVDDLYLGGVKAAKYDALVDTCVELLASNEKLIEQERLSHETIKKLPQSNELKGLLSGLS